MASPMTIAQFSKLVDPAVRKHFFDEYSKAEPKLEMVFKVEDQQDYNEQEQNYAGLGSIAAVAEGERIPEDSFLQTYGTTYTPTKYAGAIAITYETKLWEKIDIVSKVPEQEAKAAARKVEQIGASVFNNGFNTAYTSYGDGKPLFSTIHTRADGGTAISNASTSGITFTEANLEVAQIAMEELLDDRGQIIEIYADTLLVPPALRKEGLIVLKSEYRSGVADNDINVYNGSFESFPGAVLPNLIVWKNLATYAGGLDTRWFLVDSKNHKVKFKWGDRVSVERDDSSGFLTDQMLWKVRFVCSTGWSDFRGVWGSKGDGGSYTS